MRTLTFNEQHAVSGSGEYFDSFTVTGGKIGGFVISPFALVGATFAGDDPRSGAAPLIAMFLLTWAGVSLGATLGGIIGATADWYKEVNDEIVG